MSDLKDKLLEAVPGVAIQEEKKPLAFEIPEKFNNIPESVISLVSIYMQTIIDYKRKFGDSFGKEVEVRKLIVNGKKMFSDGIKRNDNLWMQHCAASIREIVCFIKPEDFHKAIRCIPDISNQLVEDDFSAIIKIKDYISDIVHFVPGPRKGKVDEILKNRGFGQKNDDVFSKEEQEFVFEEICIKLIYKLNDVFVKYCVGE
jgi:hypothetical protein